MIHRAEKHHCRQCQMLRFNRKSFVVTGARAHYAPDLPVRLEHLKLEVELDPVGSSLTAVTTQTVKVVADGLKRLKLDQIGLKFHSVLVNQSNARWSVEGNSLWVDLPESVTARSGETLTLEIRYEVRHPKRGLYFTGPDKDYPSKPHQVWSQGQDEDNRHWIPTFDYPNQKATTEVIAIVPEGYTAISNGALLSKSNERGKTRFHYRLGTPHVTYLITLVVGKFTAWEDKGPNGLPVQYFVEPGREADGKRAFGNTPKMIEAFARKTGVNYPYEKYSQVAVQDFIFGGMENTSATTQTDKTLHDERSHPEATSDPLVAHELAHQWFGDLLTCRDWSHGWLNEGFATFMERVWIEESENGEEARYYSYQDLKEYQSEDSERYRRPIVSNTYLEPIDLFDTHLYQKGGLVLGLLRATLGEQAFWKSIQLYLQRHRGQSVETLDLIRAIEDATGKNMRRFFDEWIFKAGYPEFELSYQWHEDTKLVELVIEQKQTQGKEELNVEGAVTPLFHLPVQIEIATDQGTTLHRIDLGECRDRVFLPSPSKPKRLRFDPGNTIPKSLKFPRPKEMLLDQLANDPDCMGRIEAALELSKVADAEIVEALARALKTDRFWGVQVEIAEILAKLATGAARDALMSSLSVSNPKARRAVVKALGKFKGQEVADALKPLAEKDASYFVEGEAIRAWVACQVTPSMSGLDPKVDEIESFVLAQLVKKESHLEFIRGQCLLALGDLPGVSRGERPNALQALLEWSKRGRPEDARVCAIDAMGAIARVAVPAERARLLARMSELALEDSFRVRRRLIMALVTSEAPEAISALETIRQLDTDGRIRRGAMEARDHLVSSGSKPDSLAKMQSWIEQLETEQRKLKGELEELRARNPR